MENQAISIQIPSNQQVTEESKQELVLKSSQDEIRIRIKTLLAARSMSQSKLGDEMGRSKGYISEIINSKRPVSVQQKIQIARILGVDSRVIWP